MRIHEPVEKQFKALISRGDVSRNGRVRFEQEQEQEQR